jgi:hypothetical protein
MGKHSSRGGVGDGVPVLTVLYRSARKGAASVERRTKLLCVDYHTRHSRSRLAALALQYNFSVSGGLIQRQRDKAAILFAHHCAQRHHEMVSHSAAAVSGEPHLRP